MDGKARLAAETYCDGLGACLGECPQGAIRIVEREAAPFQEVVGHGAANAMAEQMERTGGTGCPGAAMRDLKLDVLPAGGPKVGVTAGEASGVETPALGHWPIQLNLVPANASFLRGADLFLVADCVPFACAGFHSQILQRRPVVIGCPKLDNTKAYVEKLAAMLTESDIRSLTVVHMEVPCCTNLVRIAGEAMRVAGRAVPLTDVTVSLRGEIRREAR